MSEVKDHQLTEAQIKILSEFEDKLSRALKGESVSLNSIAERKLGNIHFEVFGVRQSMVPCCGGMRTTAARLTPLAKAYFDQASKPTTPKTPKTKAAKKDSESLKSARQASENASAHLESVKAKTKARRVRKPVVKKEPEPIVIPVQAPEQTE